MRLESIAMDEEDLFSQKGLQLIADGAEPELIREIMEADLDIQESNDLACAKVYDAMGGYSPTIGIIGAVLGLIHVMGNLADPLIAWRWYCCCLCRNNLWCCSG